jgi:hypothetical protein
MEKANYSKYDIEYENKCDPYSEFNSQSSPLHIANQIQIAVDNMISSCPDPDWNENLLTYKLVEILRITLSYYKLPKCFNEFSLQKFNVEAYKLTGSVEHSHGDIAIIVSKRFSNRSEPISGVAFYEAKASRAGFYNSDEFPSFSVQQLRRLVTSNPRLNYLFYKKKSWMIGGSDWSTTEDIHDYLNEARQEKYSVNAAAVDANFLKNCKSIHFAAQSFGLPFGKHFVERVLSGRDLDYSRPVDKAIKRWLKDTRGSTPFIISVSIQDEFNEPFSTQLALPGFEKLKFPEFHAEKDRIKKTRNEDTEVSPNVDS